MAEDVQDGAQGAVSTEQSENGAQGQQTEHQGAQETLMNDTLLGGAEGGEKAAEGNEAPAPKQEEKTEEVVPENYESFKDLDGNEYAPESVQQFADAAKKVGLTQQKAQELFESMVPTARAHMMNDLRAKAQQWSLDCEKDPEIGGANFGANKAVAIAGYREFATPELRTILNASGLGNHPEVVRHFYRLGKTLQQDHGVHGEASGAPQKHRRYPNSNMVVDE